jgi:histone H3/H4
MNEDPFAKMFSPSPPGSPKAEEDEEYHSARGSPAPSGAAEEDTEVAQTQGAEKDEEAPEINEDTDSNSTDDSDSDGEDDDDEDDEEVKPMDVEDDDEDDDDEEEEEEEENGEEEKEEEKKPEAGSIVGEPEVPVAHKPKPLGGVAKAKARMATGRKSVRKAALPVATHRATKAKAKSGKVSKAKAKAKSFKLSKRERDARKRKEERNYKNAVRKYQKSTKLLIEKTPMQRLCKEIGDEVSLLTGGKRWAIQATNAVHEAAEAYLVQVLARAWKCTKNDRRKTLLPRDLRTAREIVDAGWKGSS